MQRAEVTLRRSGAISPAVVALVDGLLQHLHRPEESPAYIHRIRVDIKRLRAWLCLVRGAADFDWRALDRRLRDCAGRLSPSRDAHVVLDTLKRLESRADGKEKDTLVLLRSRLHFTPAAGIDWQALKPELAAALAALRDPAVALDTEKILRRGLQRCYKRAMREGRRALSDRGGIAELHELRKWVKYLYYQLQFVNKARPGSYVKTRKRLDKLGDRLGRIHDLDLLHRRLAQLPPGEDWAPVERLLARRLRKQLKSSRRLYMQAFHKRPSKFLHPLAG